MSADRQKVQPFIIHYSLFIIHYSFIKLAAAVSSRRVTINNAVIDRIRPVWYNQSIRRKEQHHGKYRKTHPRTAEEKRPHAGKTGKLSERVVPDGVQVGKRGFPNLKIPH